MQMRLASSERGVRAVAPWVYELRLRLYTSRYEDNCNEWIRIGMFINNHPVSNANSTVL